MDRTIIRQRCARENQAGTAMEKTENYARVLGIAFFARLGSILLVTLVFGAAAVAIAYYYPPVYSFDGSIVVKSKKIDRAPESVLGRARTILSAPPGGGTAAQEGERPRRAQGDLPLEEECRGALARRNTDPVRGQRGGGAASEHTAQAEPRQRGGSDRLGHDSQARP